MMRYKGAMRLLRILILALMIASPAAAQRSGMYDVTGRNPDGTDYVGTLMLQQVGVSSFRISWTIAGNVIEGAGMVSGLMLGVVFQLGEQTGLGMYELRPNGELVGTWTILGSQATGQETLRPR